MLNLMDLERIERKIDSYQIPQKITKQLSLNNVEFFGSAKTLQSDNSHELIISGPAETGKTRACLEKLHSLCLDNPNLQTVIIRKTYNSALSSCIETFDNKVIPELLQDNYIDKYGGERVQFYLYPNGSRIWIGGLDKASKVLSSERDIIYVNQAEELEEEEWEMLLSRATGRAGNIDNPQVIGDCNPSHSRHWILSRAKKSLNLLHSTHEDNPTLFKDGEMTKQGERTLSILDNLSGARKERLRYGRWAEAEGAIYQFNPAIHLIDNFDIPEDWRRIRAIDFGLSNPFTCLWIAADEDNRLYVYRQIYMTGRTVATHSSLILDKSSSEKITETVCDHDAEDRLTLRENDIPNVKANKAVLRGIGKVQERLKVQKDKRPRLFILKNSLVEVDRELEIARKPLCLEDEFPEYIWRDNAKKDEPTKANDHALDALRYGIMYFDGEFSGKIEDIKHNPFYD